MRAGSGIAVALAALAASAATGCIPATGQATMAPEPTSRYESSERMLSLLDAVATDAESRMDPPRVWLRTHAPFRGANRVDLSFGVTADAYVLVGIVGRDGELHVEFPTRPTAAHFVPGSRVLELRNLFTGFDAPPAGSGLHPTRSAIGDYYRNTGYAFAIASDRPLDLEALDEMGWWETELARDLQGMSPRLFAHRIASMVVAEGAEYSIDAVSVRLNDATGTTLAYGAEGMPFGYANAYCMSSGQYLTVHPLQAQWLIRQQLAAGCSVPNWAITRYLFPYGSQPPTVTRPRQPVPEDTTPPFTDGRRAHTQVRTHMEDRARETARDSAAEAQRLLMLRAEAMRREIQAMERLRAEAGRGRAGSAWGTAPERRADAPNRAADPSPAQPSRRARPAERPKSEPAPGRAADPGPRESVRRRPDPQPAPQRTRERPAERTAPSAEPPARGKPTPGHR